MKYTSLIKGQTEVMDLSFGYTSNFLPAIAMPFSEIIALPSRKKIAKRNGKRTCSVEVLCTKIARILIIVAQTRANLAV